MRVLITGANGFIAKNLQLHLAARSDVQMRFFMRADSPAGLAAAVEDVDFVFHLAGVNRPQDPSEFKVGNVDLTSALCDIVRDVAAGTGKAIPVVYTSSTQAGQDNPYGCSKRAAEQALCSLAEHGVPVYVARLPNVFGKWAKPNYNSAVATFCHNIVRDLPIAINDPDAPLTLVYVEDVVERFIQLLDGAEASVDEDGFERVGPQYTTTVGQVVKQLRTFRDSRATLVTERVGTGLTRALYATYVSYLPPEQFAYSVPQYSDPRGVFTEMLKTPDCGQFSYFTAHPGITRGGHYHHSKTEKFLVISGQARFKFRHMMTDEIYDLFTSGEKAEIVETVPGWTHDITNIGTGEMVVLLWVNEVFNRDKPDTYACVV